jgi:hypothetical protein
MTLTNIRSNSRYFALGVSTDTAFSDADILLRSNQNYGRLIAMALRAQGNWSIVGRTKVQTSIAAATRQYLLPTTFLSLKGVEIKYGAGATEYVTADLISESEFAGFSRDSYTTATPKYAVFGGYIEIFLPAKTADIVAVTNGINIYYQDDITALSGASDETILPEFANDLLAMMNARDYCGVNGLTTRLGWLTSMIGVPQSEETPATGEIAAFLNYLETRLDTKRPRLAVRREDYGQSAM